MSKTGFKVLICGAGKIGRGFVAHLCQRSQADIYFYDVNQSLIDQLNEAKAYPVYMAGSEQRDMIDLKQAFSPKDQDALRSLMKDVDVVVTCVGAAHIASTVAGIRELLKSSKRSAALNWIICENANQPAKQIKQVLLDGQDDTWCGWVESSIGLIETQVLRSGMPVRAELAEREPLALSMQDWWTLPADADAVIGEMPDIYGLELKSNFGNELQRKIYTFNGLNGPISYMGHLYGFEFLHESANAEALQDFYDQIQAESGHGLINEFGFDEQEHKQFQQLARRKYENPDLCDQIERNARDSERKLGVNERLVGPALLCLKHGREPVAYARAIAAACLYTGSDDAGTTAVQSLLHAGGAAAVLQAVAGLASDHPLCMMVCAAGEELKELVKDSISCN